MNPVILNTVTLAPILLTKRSLVWAELTEGHLYCLDTFISSTLDTLARTYIHNVLSPVMMMNDDD